MKKIKDLKMSDVCYRVYDNGNLELLYLLNNHHDKETHINTLIFQNRYNQVYTFYQFLNESYIMNELDTVYLNKEDAINDLNKIKERIDESLEILED
jgi:hypothetical protein